MCKLFTVIPDLTPHIFHIPRRYNRRSTQRDFAMTVCIKAGISLIFLVVFCHCGQCCKSMSKTAMLDFSSNVKYNNSHTVILSMKGFSNDFHKLYHIMIYILLVLGFYWYLSCSNLFDESISCQQ